MKGRAWRMKRMSRKGKIGITVICTVALFAAMNILVFSLTGYWSRKMKAEGLCQRIEAYVKEQGAFSERYGEIVSVCPERKALGRMEQISENEFSIYCVMENDKGQAVSAKLRVVFEDNSSMIRSVTVDEP